MTKVNEAICTFLASVTPNYATDLTTNLHEMEVQVMVTPGDEPVYDGDKLIRNTWQVCDDDYGTYSFHHIRIPKMAMSDPNWHDSDIGFPLHRHVEAIGMTGWNWERRKSCWAAFDFDAITGHAKGVGVSDDDLEAVKQAACKIPWVQVRRSTGGAGLHLYVYFDPEDLPDTENHNEHAAVARAVLGMMERAAGFDFRGSIDVFGGNMWVWHSKVTAENRGLSIINDKTEYCPLLPSNWKDNLEVVTGKATKVQFAGVEQDQLDRASATAAVAIDDIHTTMEERIHALGYSIIWVPDYRCWQTHAKAFQELMEQYPDEYKGAFQTLSEGTDKGKPNVFCFPVRNGGLRVTKFGRGAREHETWNQDGKDWTWTYFNHTEPIATALTKYAVRTQSNRWAFSTPEDFRKMLRSTGCEIDLPFEGRDITVRQNGPDYLVCVPFNDDFDEKPAGWVRPSKNEIQFPLCPQTPDDHSTRLAELDEKAMCLRSRDNEIAGWAIVNDGDVTLCNKSDVKDAHGKEVVRDALLNPFWITAEPLQAKILPGRRLNLRSPRLRTSPQPGDCSMWWNVMDHLGMGLTAFVQRNEWCKRHGIRNGADYLVTWVASAIRQPKKRTAVLLLIGEQNSGKSLLYESIDQLLISGGVANCTNALVSGSGFNGEMINRLFCYSDEKDLSDKCYDRIKEWCTGLSMPIHEKNRTPFEVDNVSHWIITINKNSYAPDFDDDDTRITAIETQRPENPIGKDYLLERLSAQAPAFLHHLMSNVQLPQSDRQSDRLVVPQVKTSLWYELARATDPNGWFTKFHSDHLLVSTNGEGRMARTAYLDAVHHWAASNGKDISEKDAIDALMKVDGVVNNRKVGPDREYGYHGVSLVNITA